jgi:outer membrane protein assembly factor BamB
MTAGRIFFLSPEKFLASIDARSGEILWKTADADLLAAIGPLFSPQPRWTGLSPFPYLRSNQEFLFFSGPRMPRIVTVSARDGKLAWRKDVPLVDGGSVHLLLRDDAIYAIGHGPGETSFTMDYQTGEIQKRFLGRRACTIATGTADSIFYRAPGGTVRLDLASGIEEHIAPMRPPCYEGVIVSGGLLYWGPWKCRCQLSLYGHIALASAGHSLARTLPDESRLVLGPGDPASVETFPVDANDWPCYQADNARTSATQAAIAKQVSRRWAFQLPPNALPTAPVAAGDLVFLGDSAGVVRAFDAADGTPRWQAHTAAAIFFPPALWEGRLYVGSADGYVYAFEATSGRLLWKFLAAPFDRRIPVFGKLISTWPVAGGVVVRNGTLYAAAGIAHYDGTHVYALDAVSGKVRWHNDTSGSLSQEVKSGVSLQGGLRIVDHQLQFCGGNAYPLAAYDLATGHCATRPNDQAASGSRTAFYPYYPEHGRYEPLNHPLPDGRSLDYAVDYGGEFHSPLALVDPLPPGVAPLPPLWRIPVRGQRPTATPKILWEDKSRARFTGFVVGLGALLTAGETATPAGPKPFLASVDIQNGSPAWREELPAPVVKSGLAVDHQARIIAALENGQVLCFAEDQ